MAEACTIRLMESAAELAAFAGRWAALWADDPRAKPFQHPAWLVPWWRQFGQERLLACTLWMGAELVGLLPAYVYQASAEAERQLLLVGAGTSDYLDGVFARECTVELVGAGLERLRDEGGWDVAYFTQLAAGSLLGQALERVKTEAVSRFRGESCSRLPAVAVAGLPKKVRAEVLYFRNAAIGRGKLRLRVAAEEDALDTFEQLVRLHTARWQAAGEAGVLADPLVLAWHREAIAWLQASGLLRLYALELAGEEVAVLYALRDRAGRTEMFYLIGSAPEHAEVHPGTLLMAMAMEHAAGEGVEVIDMLRGEEVYKKFWRVEEVPTFGFAVRRGLL